MSRPRLLDLFCGAGGAARGYQLAGFEVVGVDIRPQPRYAGDRFVQADVMAVGLETLLCELGRCDAVHASPPCQANTILRNLRQVRDRHHADLIAEVRDQLAASGLPWVIENVPGAPLRNPVLICGSMFDPVMDVRRHRLFEANWPLAHPMWPCRHRLWGPRFEPNRSDARLRPSRLAHVLVIAGHDSRTGNGGVEAWREAMGIDWMTRDELAQAIPPAYTELIGAQLMTAILTANRANPSEPVGTRGDNLPRHLNSPRTGGNPSEPVGTSAKLRSPSVAGPAQGPAEFASANSNPPLPLSPELTAGPSGDSHSDSQGRRAGR